MQKRSAIAGLVLGLGLGVTVPTMAATTGGDHIAARQPAGQTQTQRLQWYENRYSALQGLAASWQSADAAKPGTTIQAKVAAAQLRAAMSGR